MGKAARYLSTSERESIARSLLSVMSVSGDELICLCPNHPDKNPSFSYNPNKDVGHCFNPACGFSGDIIKIWTRVKGYGDKEGFKAFCQGYNIPDVSEKLVKKDQQAEKPGLTGLEGGASGDKKTVAEDLKQYLDDVYQMLGPLPESMKGRLEKERGWNVEVMDSLGFRLQTHFRDKKTGQIKSVPYPDRVALPVYDDTGHIVNIRLYKPFNRQEKIPKMISWGKTFGKNQLFPCSPVVNDDVVLVCEGEPDVICAKSNGFNAITQTGKQNKWPKKQLNKFINRDVVIAYDADQPGQKYAEMAAREIAGVAKSVRVLIWSDFMGKRTDGNWPENHGQDLTDFFVTHGRTADDLKNLIAAAPYFSMPESDILSQPLEFFAPGVNGRLSFKARLLAEKIMSLHNFLYVPETGLFYRYKMGYWQRFPEENLNTIAIKLLGNEAKQAWVRDAVFQVMSLCTLPPDRALNDKENWLCVLNCMVHAETLETREHDPDFYSSYQLPVIYNQDLKTSGYKCDIWLKTLRENIQTPPVIDQLQEFFGYCLYRKTPFAKCLLLICPGGGGKSTILHVLTEMVGRENCASITFNEMEDQFLRSTLYQKSVNICGEVSNKIKESTYFKAVTSGDNINASFKHKNPFTFEPHCKVIFSGNRFPLLRDTSDGINRRILPITFKRQYLEGDPDTDPFLKQKLIKELSGIFLWSLEGLRRLLKNNQFTACDETIHLMMDYKRLNNHVLCYAEDVCKIDETGRASKKDLYKSYENYCNNNGYRPYSKENFFKELYAAFDSLKTFRPRSENPRREVYLQGIRLVGEIL